MLAAARRGEESAVTTLYQTLQPPLLGYLRAFEPAEAEDLASDVWLGIGRSIAKFEGDEAAFRGWMFTIARRRVVDLRRRRGRRQTEPAPVQDFVAIAGPDNPESTVLDALGAQEARLLIADLLPPDQADAILLRVVGGLDTAQIAAVLGKRPGAVRVLQHRALRRLAKEFSARGVTK